MAVTGHQVPSPRFLADTRWTHGARQSLVVRIQSMELCRELFIAVSVGFAKILDVLGQALVRSRMQLLAIIEI